MKLTNEERRRVFQLGHSYAKKYIEDGIYDNYRKAFKVGLILSYAYYRGVKNYRAYGAEIDVSNIVYDGRFKVYSKFNSAFVYEIRQVKGARWNGEYWSAPAKEIKKVRQILKEVYDVKEP